MCEYAYVLHTDSSLCHVITLDQEDPPAYGQWEHRDAPTHVKSRTCLAEDAAHAMVLFQGAGAGCALEDAAILATLFDAIHTED